MKPFSSIIAIGDQIKEAGGKIGGNPRYIHRFPRQFDTFLHRFALLPVDIRFVKRYFPTLPCTLTLGKTAVSIGSGRYIYD